MSIYTTEVRYICEVEAGYDVSQGFSNINIQKKERLITDEVTRNQGGTIASRYSRLESRRDACKKINAMFGLDIWCDYREDFQAIDPESGMGDDTIDSEGVEE